MRRESAQRYGVIEQTVSGTDVARACESIRHLGFSVIDGGYSGEWLENFSDAFERARQRRDSEHGGRETLTAIDEHNTIRLPLSYEPMFLELVANAKILEIADI